MFCGYWLKDHIDSVIIYVNNKMSLLIAFWLIITINNGFVDMWSGVYGKDVILFLCNAILGTFLLIAFSKKLRGYKIIEIFSKGTLLILGLHIPILNIISIIIPFNDFGLILPWFKSFIVLCICYYPIKICLKYCPSILGK